MLKKSYITIALSVTFILGWVLIAVPYLTKIPSDFSYTADIFSVDNFYDEEIKGFKGRQVANTNFSYNVTENDDGILIINNIFNADTIDGELIFTAERNYGIDPFTGKHVAEYGDRSRQGYLFGPKGTDQDSFNYWHIGYDEPATMKFHHEDIINGLTLHHFIADYHADNTNNLLHLPGVPEERGVNFDINLHLWIEPVTGYMVKYQDNTTAYFYDVETHERIHPWNKFSNRYSNISVNKHLKNAREAKFMFRLYNWWVPILIVVIATQLFCLTHRKNCKIIKK